MASYSCRTTFIYIGNQKKEANIYAYIALTILALSIIFAVRFPKRLNYQVLLIQHIILYIYQFFYILLTKIKIYQIGLLN